MPIWFTHGLILHMDQQLHNYGVYRAIMMCCLYLGACLQVEFDDIVVGILLYYITRIAPKPTTAE